MILLSFAKVGPSEYTAWHRGHNWVISKRGVNWIVAFDGKLIHIRATHGKAVDAAHTDAAERKARGAFNR